VTLFEGVSTSVTVGYAPYSAAFRFGGAPGRRRCRNRALTLLSAETTKPLPMATKRDRRPHAATRNHLVTS